MVSSGSESGERGGKKCSVFDNPFNHPPNLILSANQGFRLANKNILEILYCSTYRRASTVRGMHNENLVTDTVEILTQNVGQTDFHLQE